MNPQQQQMTSTTITSPGNGSLPQGLLSGQANMMGSPIGTTVSQESPSPVGMSVPQQSPQSTSQSVYAYQTHHMLSGSQPNNMQVSQVQDSYPKLHLTVVITCMMYALCSY